MKAFIASLLHKISKKKDASPKHMPGRAGGYEQRYPVAVMERHLGDMIEVHYLDLGLSQIVQARLNSRPTREAFYVSLNGYDMNIVYWNTTHADGRLSAVRMIKHRDHVLYNNDGVPFNYDAAEKHDSTHAVQGPVRRLTREYLSGTFG